MTLTELYFSLPLLALTTGAIVLLLTISFVRRQGVTLTITLVTFIAAGATLPLLAARQLPQPVTPLLVVDDYGLFFVGLLLAVGAVVTLLAFDYFRQREGHFDELYLLLLLATLGAAVLVLSQHFVSFVLGLEILTVSLYTLIAYLRTERSIEAGLKYLILAAVSSSFLLFGLALVYADLGAMSLPAVAGQLAGRLSPQNILLPIGLGLMLTGIGFKLAVVPFHMWTPDIYEGASAPVTAFIATASKGAMFALLLRTFGPLNVSSTPALFAAFGLIAVASMFGGNLLALLQNNIKRLLAYSSIAHLGYLLVAFLAADAMAATAVTYYLVAYIATTLVAFGVVAQLSTAEGEPVELADYRGLFWRRPWLAMFFTVALLSLAGIPLTAGFIGKFFVVTAGVGSALWTLVIVLVLNSAIGLFYYLRVIVTMGLQPDRERPAPRRLPLPGRLTLAALVLLLLGLGIFPAPLLDIIQTTVTGLL